MIMSEKAKKHAEACRFCWMCRHICPIGNATGHERTTARARAFGISLVNRGSVELKDIMDNIYECAFCGACVHDCATAWDPIMFTKEVRLQAALDGCLPEYIEKLVDNCLNIGNAYGKVAICDKLASTINAHSKKTDTLFFLGADTRYKACAQGVKAIKILESAGVDFTVLKDEPASGAQLDFLIGAAEETKEQMQNAAKAMSDYETVVFYDPQDAKTVKQTFGEYGIDFDFKAVTYTAFLSELLKIGALKAEKKCMDVAIQDAFQLARDLGETEEIREIVSAFRNPCEMHLIKAETVFAGNVLMAEYMPDAMKLVAQRRIQNVMSAGAKAVVVPSVSEYLALKSIEQNDVEVLSLEDMILGGD